MLQKVQIGKLNQPHLFNVRWESVTLGLKSMQLLRRERRARATTNKKTLTAFSQDGKPVSPLLGWVGVVKKLGLREGRALPRTA